MANKPDDGVTGESILWKLVQGITAHSRGFDEPGKVIDFLGDAISLRSLR